MSAYRVLDPEPILRVAYRPMFGTAWALVLAGFGYLAIANEAARGITPGGVGGGAFTIALMTTLPSVLFVLALTAFRRRTEIAYHPRSGVLVVTKRALRAQSEVFSRAEARGVWLVRSGPSLMLVTRAGEVLEEGLPGSATRKIQRGVLAIDRAMRTATS